MAVGIQIPETRRTSSATPVAGQDTNALVGERVAYSDRLAELVRKWSHPGRTAKPPARPSPEGLPKVRFQLD